MAGFFTLRAGLSPWESHKKKEGSSTILQNRGPLFVPSFRINPLNPANWAESSAICINDLTKQWCWNQSWRNHFKREEKVKVKKKKKTETHLCSTGPLWEKWLNMQEMLVTSSTGLGEHPTVPLSPGEIAQSAPGFWSPVKTLLHPGQYANEAGYWHI